MIEKTEAGTIITGDSINKFVYHALLGKLCIAAGTGLNFKGATPMNQARAVCASPKRTKAGVIADYVVWMHQNGMPLGAQWGSVERVLGKVKTDALRRRVERYTK
jgi:hypothetical protein